MQCVEEEADMGYAAISCDKLVTADHTAQVNIGKTVAPWYQERDARECF